ncbi:MAG: hypothetical protein J5993_01705 [Clostridia bacterium]|nr:hypothetical protein [Clostridia bacterium]
MTKKKSAAWLVVVTIVLIIVCAVCFLSFPIPGTVKEFKSVLSNVGLGSDLGGSYYTVYYPEGVLSKEDYETRLEQLEGKEKEEFVSSYQAHGDIYLETEEMGDEFDKNFSAALDVITYRFDKLGIAGYSVAVRDDYTIAVSLPASATNAQTTFDYFSYNGTFSLGSAEGQADLGETRYHPIGDYFKHASAKMRDRTPFVQIGMTKTGREEVYTLSNNIVADSKNALYFNIGSHAVVSMTIDEAIKNSDYIYISGYTTMEQARAVAVVIESALVGRTFELSMNVGTVYEQEATYGENATTILLIALAALFLVMTVVFFVRYHGVGAAHLYAFLIYALTMIIFLACMPGIFITSSTLLAILLSAVLLTVSNVAAFRKVKAEFDLGKTITASMKVGYRKALYPTLEAHIAVLVGALLAAFIGVTELQMFGIVLAFGTVMSALCSVLLTRAFWVIMMQQAKNAFKFCNFKREDNDDED